MDHFATVFDIYVVNWVNPKFSNGYNSVILKYSTMKFLPCVQNCGLSLKMPKNRKKYFGNIFKKIFENRRFFNYQKLPIFQIFFRK